MRCKKRKFIAIFLLGLGFTGLQAQNAGISIRKY
jgi:hypothetical protein